MILAIETSCDETAVALYSEHLIGELVATQIKVHAPYGGVVPEIAAREHLACLDNLLIQLLTNHRHSFSDITEIAVTQGPGLKGCLLIGIMFAKGLALALGVPLRGVNHLEGHICAPLLDNKDLDFPYFSLLVSGGHSEIIEVRSFRDYKLIARTIDDAAGEAFDKSATMIGLPYPGGPALAKLADSINESPFSLPLVMRNRPELSFSGLKTAVRQLVIKTATKEPVGQEFVRTDFGYLTILQQKQIAFAVQEAIIKALLHKIKEPLSTKNIPITLTGGVAANLALRKSLGAFSNNTVYCPSFKHCTDNAAMIALVASLESKHNISINNNSSLLPLSRWPINNLPTLSRINE